MGDLRVSLPLKALPRKEQWSRNLKNELTIWTGEGTTAQVERIMWAGQCI